MARFVISNRRAGKFSDREKIASRDSLASTLDLLAPSIQTLADRARGETSRRTVVMEADPSEIEAKRGSFGPDVIVEREILHYKANQQTPFDLTKAASRDLHQFLRQSAVNPDFLGSGSSTKVEVRGRGAPIANAEVLLFLTGPGGLREKLEARTDQGGIANFQYGSFYRVLGAIVSPHGGYWPKLVRGGGQRINVTCQALPRRAVGWWHSELKSRRGDGEQSGEKIRVGVIDSGCGPHPALNHVRVLGSFIDGVQTPTHAAGMDSGSHGTHVCGIVGALSLGDGEGYVGVSTGVDLMSVRVFPPNGGANQGDIADAIDLLSGDEGADLINMSLGASVGSQIELDAIIDALERGTLCICAAANSSGPVEFPAAFPETVAVAAAGKLGWVPADSMPALPSLPELFGDDQLYAAEFTCFGPEIDCIAPGVGIISPVPARFADPAPYAPMNGTSMASPAACGALAGILARDADYQTMPRGRARAGYARSLLVSRSCGVGLPSVYEGRGMPRVR